MGGWMCGTGVGGWVGSGWGIKGGSETTSRLGNYGTTRKLRKTSSLRFGNYDFATRKLQNLDSETTESTRKLRLSIRKLPGVRLGNYADAIRKLPIGDSET